jgi:hypothetical protein
MLLTGMVWVALRVSASTAIADPETPAAPLGGEQQDEQQAELGLPAQVRAGGLGQEHTEGREVETRSVMIEAQDPSNAPVRRWAAAAVDLPRAREPATATRVTREADRHSQRQSRSHRIGNEQLAERRGHGVLGPPAGAVRCAWMNTDGGISSRSAITLGISGSNAGRLRGNPPTTACSGRSCVRRRAERQMLTTPEWPQPVRTISPLSRMSTTSAWSSRTRGSGSHVPPSRARVTDTESTRSRGTLTRGPTS